MKLNSCFSTKGPSPDGYLFNARHLCARAGVDGFVCRSADWASHSSFPDKSNSPSYLKTVDPIMSVCLRVFTRDLGRVAIPQLALYPPESGYPLCKPESFNSYRKGSRETTYNRFFFTVPMAHVNLGLVTGKCSSVYTTFFSNVVWDKKSPISHISEMSKYPPNYLTFPTGKNILDKKDVIEFRSPWTVDLDLTDDMPLDIATVCGTGAREVMPLDAFARYLPYYLWYYPVTLAKIKGYTFGSAGDIKGAYQGNLKYYSYNEDAFVGAGYIWKRYFGLAQDYNWASGLSLGWSNSNFNYTNVSDYAVESLDYQLMYNGIPTEVLQELAIIRAAIQSSKLVRQFKYFPFSSKPKQKDFGRTKIDAPYLKKISSIIQCSKRLAQYSKVEHVKGKKCPLCTKDLLLPEILITKGASKEVMCVSCGFKALSNMYYLAAKQVNEAADSCIWANDIDMSAVLDSNMIVKTPDQSVIGN